MFDNTNYTSQLEEDIEALRRNNKILLDTRVELMRESAGLIGHTADLEATLAERDKRIAELENMLQCEANLASNKGEEARELREALLAIRDVSICDCDEDADDDEVRDYCPYCIAHKILEDGR